MAIRLRFYRQRYNMDYDYYTGDEDIYKRVKLDDLDDLKLCWPALIHDYEGETYSAWAGQKSCDYFLCGGALDPGDIDCIRNEFGKIKEGLHEIRSC